MEQEKEGRKERWRERERKNMDALENSTEDGAEGRRRRKEVTEGRRGSPRGKAFVRFESFQTGSSTLHVYALL